MLNQERIQKTWSTIYFNKFFILQEDTKIKNSYLAHDRHSKDIKQKLTELKGECSFLVIGISPIIAGDFKSALTGPGPEACSLNHGQQE